MNNQPAISVVMPVYNVGHYLEEAIKSILNQTYTDFEFIIIDDCSTDSTLEVVRSFSDPRIKLIVKKENLGLIHSLNLGFQLSRGKYIARMDGDDISDPERFQKQITILEKNPKFIACGSWIKHFGKNDRLVKHKESHNEILTQMLLKCPMTMGGAMLRRDTLGKIKFDEKRKHVEDYDFWARTVWMGEFYNIQEVLYYYRVHDRQVSTIHYRKQVLEDIPIKLYLFKKISYDTLKYSDQLIKKMLLLNEPLELRELSLFLNWLKKLEVLNLKTKVYPQEELKNVLRTLNKSLLISLFLKKSDIGINWQWRLKALFVIDGQDAFHIIRLKGKEKIKGILKNK